MDYRSCSFASSESESDISSDEQELDEPSNSFQQNYDKEFNDFNIDSTFGRTIEVDMMDSSDNSKINDNSIFKSKKNRTNDNVNKMEMPFNPKAYGKGFNMLAKMGYKGGGLGKDGSGRVQPIIVTSNKGKQVDIVDNNTTTDVISKVTCKKLPVKFIDQDETSISATERWSSDFNSVSDMSDAIHKCENFINTISQGKLTKLESSRTRGSIGTLVTTLISQAQYDLVNSINKKNSEKMEVDRKINSSKELRDKLTSKKTKLDNLQSLLINFNMGTAINIEDDSQEIVASYISSSMIKIEVDDFIHSPNIVDDMHNQCSKVFNQGDANVMLTLEIKKRIYESHLVRPLVQFFKQWNVEKVEQGLEIYTKWDDFRSLSTLPIQVITAKIIEWLKSSKSVDIIPPHMIIHPWLPYLNDTEQLYTCLIKLFYSLVQNREDLAVPLIDKWHFLRSDTVSNSFKELIEYIREKFRSQITSINISFDMKVFLSLVDSLLKSNLYSNDMIAKDISSLVYKYAKVVKNWIKDGEIERVVESYQLWSDTLNPILDHSMIKPHFLDILNAMNDTSDDIILDDVISEDSKYIEESKSETQRNIFVQQNVQQVINSASNSSGKVVNLFDYLSKVAVKKGIDLRPKVGRMHDGKQVYAFGKVLIVVERLLIHAMIDKVWKPVDIPQLLKLA